MVVVVDPSRALSPFFRHDSAISSSLPHPPSSTVDVVESRAARFPRAFRRSVLLKREEDCEEHEVPEERERERERDG